MFSFLGLSPSPLEGRHHGLWQRKTSQIQEDAVPHVLSPIYGAWVYIDAHRSIHESKAGGLWRGERHERGREGNTGKEEKHHIHI